MDNSIESLITDNYKLVPWAFHKYIPKSELSRSHEDDLISEGYMGLCKAAKTFDESRGIKFATYSIRCILNSMRMYIRKLKRYEMESSLDFVLNTDSEGNELTLMDIIPDENEELSNYIHKLDQRDSLAEVYEELSKVSERERGILLSRAEGATQREVATTLDISKSYLSRLETKIARKIRIKIHKKEGLIMARGGRYPSNPDSPKRKDYADKISHQRDNSRYQYCKRIGIEFVPNQGCIHHPDHANYSPVEEGKKKGKKSQFNGISKSYEESQNGPITRYQIPPQRVEDSVSDQTVSHFSTNPIQEMNVAETSTNEISPLDIVIKTLGSREQSLLNELYEIRRAREALSKVNFNF